MKKYPTIKHIAGTEYRLGDEKQYTHAANTAKGANAN